MHKTAAGKQIYIVSVGGSFDDQTNGAGAAIHVIGCPSISLGLPADVLTELAVFSASVTDGHFSYETFIEVEPATRLAMLVEPNNTTASIQAWFVTVELPPSGRTRTRDDVIREANASNMKLYSGYVNPAVANPFFLEYTVNDKLINQPAAQVPPAVADELKVVSTSASDDAAGIGARTIKFKYLDASLAAVDSNAVTMDGTTPVDLIGTYADVFVITESWVVTVGSFGRNVGDILFQDA